MNLGAGGDLFVPVAHPRQDDPDWFRVVIPHHPDLAGRGVRAEQHVGIGRIKGVLHFPGGVMRREIEQLKVHLIRFNVPAAIDLETHIGPNLVNPA